MAGTLTGRRVRAMEGLKSLISGLTMPAPFYPRVRSGTGPSVPYDELGGLQGLSVHMYPRFSTVCPHQNVQFLTRPPQTAQTGYDICGARGRHLVQLSIRR